MHTFRAAQPALLYLSPATVLSLIGCAWIRGELESFWSFDDGSEDEPKKAPPVVVDTEEKKKVEKKNVEIVGFKEE